MLDITEGQIIYILPAAHEPGGFVVNRFLLAVLVAAVLLAILSSAEASSTTLEVVITSPEEGMEINDDFHIGGTASPNGSVERVEVRLDGHKWLNASGTDEWSYWVGSDTLEHGPNVIEARAWGGEGYSPIVSRSYTMNNRPTITGAGWTMYPTSMHFMGHANDDGDNLVRVEMSVDNGTWFTVNGTDVWNHEISLDDLTIGFHSVAVRAYDGNTHSHESYEFFEINHGPELKVTTNDITLDGQRILFFNGTAKESQGVVLLVYRIDQGEWVNVTITGAWFIDVDTDALTIGDHTVIIKAFDGRNFSEPYIYEFTIGTPKTVADYVYVVTVVGITVAIVLVVVILIRRYNREW